MNLLLLIMFKTNQSKETMKKIYMSDEDKMMRIILNCPNLQ
jgi:hypothetical protein